MKDWEQEVENLSREFHAVYQEEAKRQASIGVDTVRHPDDYDSLPERTKEYDRVLARHVIKKLQSAYREGLLRGAEIASEICHCGNGTATHIRPSKTCTGRLVAETIRREAQ